MQWFTWDDIDPGSVRFETPHPMGILTSVSINCGQGRNYQTKGKTVFPQGRQLALVGNCHARVRLSPNLTAARKKKTVQNESTLSQ
ncbi:MAG: hypothetical protein JEZ11_11475 [Desulfobacterales bacterium]|nr:hypothetical protein [Desulfobacterales bacterium]